MREFFRGWKRKLGVATLLMACVFMAGWVRSGNRGDIVRLRVGNSTFGLHSIDGGIDLYHKTEHEPLTVHPLPEGIFSHDVNLINSKGVRYRFTPWSAAHQIKWRWDWMGFHVGAATLSKCEELDCMIPYWSIVIPLTLLSAYLLLSTPRQEPFTTQPDAES